MHRVELTVVLTGFLALELTVGAGFLALELTVVTGGFLEFELTGLLSLLATFELVLTAVARVGLNAGLE